MPLQLSSLSSSLSDFTSEHHIALALSGGGDSMALAHLLSTWGAAHNVTIHLLHVDHNLRTESAAEAKSVKEWVAAFPSTKFHLLKWKHAASISKKIQEQARAARYELMDAYCRKQKIRYLFIAHHSDDQAETILFRLAKSSGIDGLAAMQFMQPYNKDLTLVRPLLPYSHGDLIDYCRYHKLKWIEDSSNQSEKFARIRLRRSKDILAEEGLTTERINQFGLRCRRAKQALQHYADHLFDQSLIKQTKSKIELSWADIQSAPAEMKIRILQKSITMLYPARAYPPALERLEDIAMLMDKKPSSKATLANCLITWSKGKNSLVISKEGVK